MRIFLLTVLCCVLFPFAWTDAYAKDPSLSKNKVAVVYSYHRGDIWNDALESSIMNIFAGTIKARGFYLNSRYATDPEELNKNAQAIRKQILQWEPDLLICCDDSAMQYVVVPYFKNAGIPIVHLGINVSAESYALSPEYATGIVETQSIERLIPFLCKENPNPRIAYIGPNSVMGRKMAEQEMKHYPKERFHVIYPESADEFKKIFMELQDQVDLIILNGRYFTWGHDETVRFMMEHTRVPTGSNYDYLAPYSVLTFAVSPEEMGAWAAKQAILILRGKPVREIPETKNKHVKIMINLPLLKQSKTMLPISLLKSATLLKEKDLKSGPKDGVMPP